MQRHAFAHVREHGSQSFALWDANLLKRETFSVDGKTLDCLPITPG
jgi:hypothetical protein